MLTIHFEGWFQCRLATDPDPSDEPRGVSGWTFAVGGEPDLDRIIRLQKPVAPRSHGPHVGVVVRSVLMNEQRSSDHPLLGAQVELLDEPKFEGRNGIMAEDAEEFIDPFHLQLEGDGVTLRRKDFLDPSGKQAYEIAPSVIRRRQPVQFEANSFEVAEATGIMNYSKYRQVRKEQLEADLQSAEVLSDPVMQAALRKRMQDLAQPGIQESALGFRLVYHFAMRGPVEVLDDQNVLGGEIGTSVPWPIEFWMGAWDADALCGFMRGKLEVPFSPTSQSS
jgi:hypothetical protein